MLSHEYFHEQAHIEKHHELKRRIFLFLTFAASLLIYRLFCHFQEYEADKLAAQKCGKDAAVESLKLLQIREKPSFWSNLFSLHPNTGKRIEKIY